MYGIYTIKNACTCSTCGTVADTSTPLCISNVGWRTGHQYTEINAACILLVLKYCIRGILLNYNIEVPIWIDALERLTNHTSMDYINTFFNDSY